MCAIAEIHISGVALSESQILSHLSKFKAHCDKSETGYTISISAYRGECLCEPEPGFAEDFRALLAQLSTLFESVIYSPNDYHVSEPEAISASLAPDEIIKKYPPSLHTPPTRIMVLSQGRQFSDSGR